MTDLVSECLSLIQVNDKPALQAKIKEFEKIALEQEQLDIPIFHHFSKSVYAREMRMPKGSMVVGKMHKHENLNILSQGEVSVLSIDGLLRVKAPHTFVASPGAKRIIYAHEDVVWTVIHGSDEKNLEKLEDEFIVKDEAEVIQLSNLKEIKGDVCLG